MISSIPTSMRIPVEPSTHVDTYHIVGTFINAQVSHIVPSSIASIESREPATMTDIDPAPSCDPEAEESPLAVAVADYGEDVMEEAPLEDTAVAEKMNPSNDQVPQKSFPMREVSMSLPFLKQELRFNWLVSAIGIVVLWALAIFCMSSSNASLELSKWYDTTILVRALKIVTAPNALSR